MLKEKEKQLFDAVMQELSESVGSTDPKTLIRIFARVLDERESALKPLKRLVEGGADIDEINHELHKQDYITAHLVGGLNYWAEEKNGLPRVFGILRKGADVTEDPFRENETVTNTPS